MNNIVLALLADPSVQFGIAFVMAILGMAFVGYVGQRVAADARLSKYARAFELLRGKAADWIITVRYGNIDLRDYNGIDYNVKAEELSLKFGRQIEPEMAFVLDRLEDEVTKKLGLKIELEEVLAAAERKYNELRYANNGLILNDKDAPAVVQAVEVPKKLTRVSVPPVQVPQA